VSASASAIALDPEAEALAGELRERGARALVALVLGSGLGQFVERLEDPTVVAGEELEHLPQSAVPGHAGRIAWGRIGDVRVLVQQGRVHLYEGWSARDVTRAVRAFAALGIRGLILTNAAGGLRAEWPRGVLMRLQGHINLQFRAPLTRAEAGAATIYDPALGLALETAAQHTGVELKRGIYAAMLGPAYETPAEVRMVQRLGADAVGMSTVCEAAAARSAGMRVAAISCITNPAAGITDEKLRHEDVVAAGQAVAADFQRLLEASLQEMATPLREGL